MDLIEARQAAWRLIAPLAPELVRLEEALGRVLAENMVAGRNLPGEPRSRLDGYALCSADCLEAVPARPSILRILPGRIAAGCAGAGSIGAGEAIRIFTGAPLPPGADAVAPQEEVTVQGENLVLEKAYGEGDGVSPAGEDARQGELLVPVGTVLNPTRLALIAALGSERVAVCRQPRVALLATGDEVRTLGALTEGPYTSCNNMHLLAWLTQLKGGKVVSLGVAADEPHMIADRLREIAADLVITTGGMGRGERDFTGEVWKRLGVEVVFNSINLLPGRNSALGKRHGQVFLGLPGNPWAAQSVFEQLGTPLLRGWQGLQSLFPAPITAAVAASVKGKRGSYRVIRGSLDLGVMPPRFHPAITRKSSVFSRVKDCFAYILLAPHVVEIAAGSQVEVMLSDFPLLASPLIKSTGFPPSD